MILTSHLLRLRSPFDQDPHQEPRQQFVHEVRFPSDRQFVWEGMTTTHLARKGQDVWPLLLDESRDRWLVHLSGLCVSRGVKLTEFCSFHCSIVRPLEQLYSVRIFDE